MAKQAAPMSCNAVPKRSEYVGLILNFSATPAPRTAPKGTMRMNARRRVPAPRGVREFTVWKRWGIWIVAQVKGPPIRKEALGFEG